MYNTRNSAKIHLINMVGIETFRTSIIETCKPELLEQYRYTQRKIQKAIRAHLEPSNYGQSDATSGLGMALMRLQELPDNSFDPESQVVKAAMMIGAVSLRAWIYKSDINGWKNTTLKDIYHRTNLEELATKCDETIDQVVPETQGRFVNISVEQMKSVFETRKKDRVQEDIVITGLNAVGKTTIIKVFTKFLEACEIKSTVIKMPRPDGPLSSVIMPALAGKLKIDKQALQFAFLADALDATSDSPDSLIVFDRNAIMSEAYVYGPAEIGRAVLATQELNTRVNHTFIVDQHPMSCAIQISKRSTQPRIFEDDVEKMTDQLIRFARLTVLPGYHWINNDIPDTDGTAVGTAVERFIGAVHFSGILQRRLIRDGRFDNHRQASDFLYSKWLDIQFEKK